MSKRANTVTLFSNGIGHFRRVYSVGKDQPAKLSIPFKSDCIGDVAASLQVFGKVRLDTPPSFTPANSNSTALKIEQSEAMQSLLKQLSGAALSLKKVGTGGHETYTLLGTDSENRYSAAGMVEQFYVVLMDGKGQISRIAFDSVDDYRFTEESVRTEIEKALKTNFQQIKPDSTLLDLSLLALEGETEAVVQYTIPVAAWKMRYALAEKDGKFTLEGSAVIDNNTDEDWKDFQISVVTGNPVSFSTDIARVVMPQRAFVHLVDGATISNVEVQEAVSKSITRGRSMSGGMTNAKFAMAACASPSTQNYMTTQGFNSAAEALDSLEDYEDESTLEAALSAGVDSKEVGDFCVFTNKELLTILARKSAVVNMFSVPVPTAGIVLYWKEASHARRPFRAIKFKNETEYSLGRGKILIYNDDLFSGECVLEASKPGDNRLLPHCVENSVRVIKTEKGQQARRSSFKISDGVVFDEHSSTAVVEYEIENKKDEDYKFVLEHQYEIADEKTLLSVEGVEVKDTEKLVVTPGQRLYFNLKAKEKLKLVFTEVFVASQSIQLNDCYWLQSAIIQTENPLSDDAGVKKCITAQEKLDGTRQGINELVARKKELVEQAARVRQNLEAVKGGPGTEVVKNWTQDLQSTEDEIRKIDKTDIPALKKQEKAQVGQVYDALKSIKVQWSENDKKKK